MTEGTNKLSVEPKPVTPSPVASGWLRPGFLSLLLAGVTLAVYWPVLHFDFINVDDGAYFSSNYHIQTGLRWSNLAWAFRTTENSSWYPLVWLSCMLDAQLFGSGPAGPHFTNLLLHAVNSILLFLLLRRLTGAHWRSALVAALFAFHPLRVESVAWISQRKDVLSLFFGLLTLWFYVRYAQRRGARNKEQGVSSSSILSPYFLSLLFFACSLLSKPMLVTLPFVMLLLDYWPLERGLRFKVRGAAGALTDNASRANSGARPSAFNLRPIWRLIWEKVPFFLVTILVSIVTLLVHKQSGMLASLEKFSIGDRIGNAFVSYARYLGKTFWPANLALPYPHPGSWPWWAVAVAATLVVGLCMAAVWLARSQPYFFTGWFWFLGTLIPVIGLVQWWEQAMADRFTYLSSIGLFILLVWGLGEVCLKWRLSRLVMGTGAVAVLVAYSARTCDQLQYWRNDETLFRHTLAVVGGNGLAYGVLGMHLAVTGQPEEAMANLQNALKVNPNDARVLTSIGWVLANQKKYAEAKRFYEAAVKLAPNYPLARQNLAGCLVVQGRYDEAIAQCNELLRLVPDDPFMHNYLGAILRTAGRLDESVAQIREAMRLYPNLLEARRNLAATLDAQGKYDEAIDQYAQLLRQSPGDAEAEFHLLVLYDRAGRPAEAIQHGQRAIRAQPDNAEAHQQLGELLARVGDKTKAVAQWREAMRLKPEWSPPLNSLAWLRATDEDAALRDGREAVMLGKKAAGVTTNRSPEVLDTLAAAYAESGQWAEAVQTAQEAIVLATASGKEKLALAISRRLELYQTSRPYRE